MRWTQCPSPKRRRVFTGGQFRPEADERGVVHVLATSAFVRNEWFIGLI
jgi:hypothetical protein